MPLNVRLHGCAVVVAVTVAVTGTLAHGESGADFPVSVRTVRVCVLTVAEQTVGCGQRDRLTDNRRRAVVENASSP